MRAGAAAARRPAAHGLEDVAAVRAAGPLGLHHDAPVLGLEIAFLDGTMRVGVLLPPRRQRAGEGQLRTAIQRPQLRTFTWTDTNAGSCLLGPLPLKSV